MSNLTYDEAKKAEGETFAVATEEGNVNLTLTQVEARANAPDFPGKTREPFSMIFTGAPGTFCPQCTYTMKNDTVGDQEIFIVPIARNEETEETTYQAVFN